MERETLPELYRSNVSVLPHMTPVHMLCSGSLKFVISTEVEASNRAIGIYSGNSLHDSHKHCLVHYVRGTPGKE